LCYGILHARTLPNINKEEIFFENLSDCLVDLKILVISDIHGSVFVSKNEVNDLVKVAKDAILEFHVDMVVLVGDISDGSFANSKSMIQPIYELNSFTKYGTFYVPGNHEDFGESTTLDWMFYHQQNGLNVLNNSNVKIAESSQCDGFNLVGLDDLSTGRDKLELALQNQTSNLLTILLAHQPNQIEKIKDMHKIDLIISGHTHSGMFFPIHTFSWLANNYFVGLYFDNGKYVFVSQGAYGGFPRTRLFSSNEIDILTLKSGAIVNPKMHVNEVSAIIGIVILSLASIAYILKPIALHFYKKDKKSSVREIEFQIIIW